MSLRDYPCSRCLGKTPYSQTFAIQNNKNLCIKIIDLQKIILNPEKLISSLSFWKNLDHPNAVKLNAIIHENQKIGLLMNYAEGISLRRLISESKSRISEKAICEIFYQVFLFIQFLHKQNKIHGDLKPENIFYTKNKEVLISDISMIIPQFQAKAYLSPEFMIDGIESASGDMWSIGCILFEMMELSPPFSGSTDEELVAKIRNQPVGSFGERYSQQLMRLASYLLMKNPKKRLDADEAVWNLSFRKISKNFHKLSQLNKKKFDVALKSTNAGVQEENQFVVKSGSEDGAYILALSSEQKEIFKKFSKVIIASNENQSLQVDKDTILLLLSETITSFDEECFYNLNTIVSVEVEHPIEKCGIRCFSSFFLQNIVLPDSLKVLDDSCFFGCSSLQKLTLPNNLVSIGSMCFFNSGIIEISIPDSVSLIGDRAFSHCKGLRYVVLSEKLTVLGNGVFFGCESLCNIVFPKSVEKIELNCFNGCNKLFENGSQIIFKEGSKLSMDALFKKPASVKSLVF